MENVTPYEMHDAAKAVLKLIQSALHLETAGLKSYAERMVRDAHELSRNIPNAPHFAITQTKTASDIKELSNVVLFMAHGAGLLFGAGYKAGRKSYC